MKALRWTFSPLHAGIARDQAEWKPVSRIPKSAIADLGITYPPISGKPEIDITC
jgi:hypothetical protein